MDEEEFSSWFNHDGGPCPLPLGTVVIQELEKTAKGAKVVPKESYVILKDDPDSFLILGSVTSHMLKPGNSWGWKYFKEFTPNGGRIARVLRYRVKKNPGVKLLEQIAQDPPKDLIPDPERKLLEYHPD